MDWRHYVREHLPPLHVSAEREIEIVDELAVQLETTFERARANGATEDEAMRRARAEVPDWGALAQTLGRIERPFAHPPAGGRRLRGTHDWPDPGSSLRRSGAQACARICRRLNHHARTRHRRDHHRLFDR